MTTLQSGWPVGQVNQASEAKGDWRGESGGGGEHMCVRVWLWNLVGGGEQEGERGGEEEEEVVGVYRLNSDMWAPGTQAGRRALKRAAGSITG